MPWHALKGCPLHGGCSAAGATLTAIVESTPTLPVQLPFKRGQALQFLLLIQAKLAFEATDEAYFSFCTTKVKSVLLISRGWAGTAGMDVAVGLLVKFLWRAECSLVHPAQKHRLYSSASYSLCTDASHGLFSSASALLPSPAPSGKHSSHTCFSLLFVFFLAFSFAPWNSQQDLRAGTLGGRLGFLERRLCLFSWASIRKMAFQTA